MCVCVCVCVYVCVCVCVCASALILEDITLTSLLGTGFRSEVRLGYHGINRLAFKCIKKTGKESYDAKLFTRFMNEVTILSSIAHPNIISLRMYGESLSLDTNSYIQTNFLYMAFDYADGGTLDSFISKTGSFSPQLVRYYFSKILSAIEYLHKLGISHRDIKPENILINNSLDALVSDFDLSGTVGIQKGTIGTIGYMAPEVEAGLAHLNESADIFALGVTLFFMMTGKHPFVQTLNDCYYEAFCDNNNEFWKMFESTQE